LSSQNPEPGKEGRGVGQEGRGKGKKNKCKQEKSSKRHNTTRMMKKEEGMGSGLEGWMKTATGPKEGSYTGKEKGGVYKLRCECKKHSTAFGLQSILGGGVLGRKHHTQKNAKK